MRQSELWSELKRRLGDLLPDMFISLDGHTDDDGSNMDEIRIHTGMMARIRYDADDNPIGDEHDPEVEPWCESDEG